MSFSIKETPSEDEGAGFDEYGEFSPLQDEGGYGGDGSNPFYGPFANADEIGAGASIDGDGRFHRRRTDEIPRGNQNLTNTLKRANEQRGQGSARAQGSID